MRALCGLYRKYLFPFCGFLFIFFIVSASNYFDLSIFSFMFSASMCPVQEISPIPRSRRCPVFSSGSFLFHLSRFLCISQLEFFCVNDSLGLKLILPALSSSSSGPSIPGVRNIGSSWVYLTPQYFS